ncbi:tricalbin-3-like isoform X2 [Camellia sinensis]|uniref:tricalbin-3-like isoform X1 n=1 Tax=Camellia sinensis TaxID=4442 RepID=UPI001035F649|nr:tricalbin-3-like isoform X1 [Camellia sinensis]XP_028119714.1 tricalbin-3-like isoform X2 [Camellia sinensis]
MIFLQSTLPTTSDSSRILLHLSPSLCPCKLDHHGLPLNRRIFPIRKFHNNSRPRWLLRACMLPTDGGNHNLSIEIPNSARRGAKFYVVKRFADELDGNGKLQLPQDSIHVGMGSNFTSFQEDPIVDKLRTQLGVIHPLPSPPINRTIVGLFVFFFFVGVASDKLWTSRKRNKLGGDGRPGTWPQVPTSFSLFFEKDLQRKESVEWVNMVLGKLWKVYRGGIENWLIGLLQPVIDNLKKPDYVQRVEIKQFSLGDEPLSVRNVERRTSRRVNDLQYQIGLRYTGGARMLLMLSLNFSIIPIVVPVGVRDFDIDGELWVKLRLIPSEPWVGAVSWAFVSLPKIKFELSPFRLFNLMAIPVLSMFLKKLLTEDLPRLFVRPKKIVLDFQKGKAVGPVPNDLKSGGMQEGNKDFVGEAVGPLPNEFKSGGMQEGNKDFVGELSVTLVDARKLSYIFFGKTDPYVVLSLGDQVIRSKKNSQTTVIGPPGEPIWNQDFHMLVANPRKQKLQIQVKDSLGFTDLTIGTGEVDLGPLKDTVPTDRIVVLRGGWGLFRTGSSGEILLRLTYKAYVEDEEDERTEEESLDTDASDDELFDSDEADGTYKQRIRDSSDGVDKESLMDVLAALIVSEEFQGIVASETGTTKFLDDAKSTLSTRLSSRGVNDESSPSNPDNASEGSGVYSFAGSALAGLAVITGILILIAINMGGSGFFNP